MFSTSVINIEISFDIEQALKTAHDLGIDQVELHSAWEKNIECMEDSELLRLKGLIDKYNLTVSCISSTLFLRTYLDDRDEIAPEIKGFWAISGNYDHHLKMLRHTFRAADILETQMIRVFPFQKTEELTDDVFTQAAEKFSLPAKLAAENGHVLVMETCPHTSFGWGKHAARLIKMIDAPSFKLLWDPAGALRAGEPDCLQSISDILPLIMHVHAKDILLLPDGNREYLAIGKGQLPWTTILQKLINTNYSGAISLEPHYRGQDGSKISAIKESLHGLNSILAACIK